MKILVYGADVIGSIYAAKLYEAGCNVTLLARGKHYEDLKQNGVIIKDTLTGKQTISKVPLAHQLEPRDFYDLIIVTVRLDQLDNIVPALKNNNACPLIMLMLNNPESTEQLTNELKPKHIILRFPGAGGTYQNNIIDYIQIFPSTDVCVNLQLTGLLHKKANSPNFAIYPSSYYSVN
jgi:2-dehydropantoate 2-reductase